MRAGLAGTARILVIGGYGGFGARLCRRLAGAGHQLLVGGRDGGKAARLCARLPDARPIAVDRSRDLAPVLARERPDLVIDAAGPFQASGYGIAEACIRAGVPYLDLADARGFVAGIGALDEAARAAGVTVISGASTAPALTGAILRELSAGLDRVEAVDIALSAANRAVGGDSVLAAALSYAGRPVRLWRGGRWARAFGCQELRREDFLFADGSGLRGRLVALVDVPDCELLPALLPGRPSVTFRAGTEIGLHMRALSLATWPVRWGWMSSLAGALPGLMRLYRLTGRIGGRRSAMSVTLVGRRGGEAVERRWTIVAEEGEGLEIPTLAAELLSADILAGRLPAGARDAAGLLSLDRFEPLLRRLPVRIETRERALPPPLYARVLGAAWQGLPSAVREMHDFCRSSGAAGEGIVVRGRGHLAGAIAAAMRFPSAGRWPLHVAFAERGGRELWTRDFGGHVFSSELSQAGDGVTERFGPLRFDFDLPSGPHGLEMRFRRWSAFRLPMPRFLAPRISAREWEEDGRFRFEVAVSLPLVGDVVGYSGWLSPAGAEEKGRPVSGPPSTVEPELAD
jgi:NAD(P)-dependent dehydrogenase (short-subunit alcohol dehydrogenase family)